jgi:hypothetical protein
VGVREVAGVKIPVAWIDIASPVLFRKLAMKVIKNEDFICAVFRIMLESLLFSVRLNSIELSTSLGELEGSPVGLADETSLGILDGTELLDWPS